MADMARHELPPCEQADMQNEHCVSLAVAGACISNAAITDVQHLRQ